ncbi:MULTISPECIES: ATP-binding protein [Achromobacter]|uniref:ATP-binding protein n=1 Tax=Achromobacter TaxID=222 RepID=UPI0009FAB6F4|nr:hypothetical protein B9P52_18765 [Achromobacter denitrificans]
MLQRAVPNLLSNALRYADVGSTVRVRIGEHPELNVSVVNVGRAIASANLSPLFHRFYRVDPARNDQQMHHGLGSPS